MPESIIESCLGLCRQARVLQGSALGDVLDDLAVQLTRLSETSRSPRLDALQKNALRIIDQ